MGGGRGTGNLVEGYVLKSDIQHYFDSVEHKILLNLIREKIKDENIIWLIKQILDGFDTKIEGKGMPLGNYTSQFFANIYLNKLDYFVKHYLKAKCYIRYVDDFVILHKRKKTLEYYQDRIDRYLVCLKLKVHPDKSKIYPLRNGITFLGYRIFYHHKLLRKRNLKIFEGKFRKKLLLYGKGSLSKEKFIESLQGWFGYARWANTYIFRKELIRKIDNVITL